MQTAANSKYTITSIIYIVKLYINSSYFVTTDIYNSALPTDIPKTSINTIVY